MTAEHVKDYCTNCGEISRMDDGMFSTKWHPGKFMCEVCLGDESWEINYPIEQPKFPKSLPLRECRTKYMVPGDVVRRRPSFQSFNGV